MYKRTINNDNDLHEVKAHGNQGHAQHQVHGANDKGSLDARRINTLARHEVTETDTETK